jgi:murein tripeptide amidase MpaA
MMSEYDTVFFAYFEPYDYEQHLRLVAGAQLSPVCRLEQLGTTVLGRDIDLLIIGEPAEGKKSIWITGRQHAGEPQASWFMEGLVNRLLDDTDAVSRTLLTKFDVYVVPMINPDGAIAGNLRTNAAGLDLNRQWADPDPEKAPEVYHILEKMKETGLDLNLDIHGDETLPYVFISGIEGIPSWDDRLAALDQKLKNAWMAANPDVQTEHGYPKNEPGKANLAICSKQVGEQFKCLSWTVEMPFKDNANLPDPIYGWSADRCARLGESLVTALLCL